MVDEPGARSRLWMRRHFLVDTRLQLGLAARAGMYTLLVLGVIGVGLFVPLVDALQGAPTAPGAGDTAAALIYLHETFWLLAGGCTLLVLIASVAVSHRIAGPMVRFKRNLRAVGSGRLPPPLRTRRHDFMQAEVSALNAMIDDLGTRSDATHTTRDRIAEELAHCGHAAEEANAPELAARLREAARQLDELGGLLLSRRDLPVPSAAPSPITPQSARPDSAAIEHAS